METKIVEIQKSLDTIKNLVSPNWKDYTLEIITILSFLISCFTLYR